MENMFTSIIGNDEIDRVKQLNQNKLKAEKILSDLKDLLPIESVQNNGYNSFHFGKIGNPINYSSKTQITFRNNEVCFWGLILIQYPNRILFDNFTYQDLLNQYRDHSSFSGSSSNHLPIKINLSDEKGLKVAYWLIRKEILNIK